MSSAYFGIKIRCKVSSFLAQAALRVSPEVAFAMRSWPLLLPLFSLSLSLLSFSFFGPGGFACATRGAVAMRSKA